LRTGRFDSSKKIANTINKNSSSAISNAIKAVNAGYKAGTNGLNSEIELFASCFETDDFVEGTNAFLEKRKPNFN
jgi:enoyl-CoA hydratase